MLLQVLLFKAQSGVPGSGLRHRVCLQLSSGCSYHCVHVELAVVDLWKWDIINLPGFPVLFTTVQQGLYPLGLLDCGVALVVVENL